jgi:hypothetical protein
MSAVTKEDVARLQAYLVVPVAVADALATAAPLEGETQYGLHVALSEIDPDSALLAIALSSYRIAQDFTGQIPVASALKMEADKIIQDYAPDWLAHYHNHPVQGDALYDLLSHVPEDLESLADLLESLQASIRDSLDPAHTLCSVLAIQARAHMEIADYVLSELENENIGANEDRDMFETPVLFADEQPSDNIILFPAHRRR